LLAVKARKNEDKLATQTVAGSIQNKLAKQSMMVWFYSLYSDLQAVVGELVVVFGKLVVVFGELEGVFEIK
jgi:hypothetical protein